MADEVARDLCETADVADNKQDDAGRPSKAPPPPPPSRRVAVPSEQVWGKPKAPPLRKAADSVDIEMDEDDGAEDTDVFARDDLLLAPSAFDPGAPVVRDAEPAAELPRPSRPPLPRPPPPRSREAGPISSTSQPDRRGPATVRERQITTGEIDAFAGPQEDASGELTALEDSSTPGAASAPVPPTVDENRHVIEEYPVDSTTAETLSALQTKLRRASVAPVAEVRAPSEVPPSRTQLFERPEEPDFEATRMLVNAAATEPPPDDAEPTLHPVGDEAERAIEAAAAAEAYDDEVEEALDDDDLERETDQALPDDEGAGEGMFAEAIEAEADLEVVEPFDASRADALRADGQWSALFSLYSTHAQLAAEPEERARLHLEAGMVAEGELADLDGAFSEYFASVLAAPSRDEAQEGLERVAHALGGQAQGRWHEATRKLQAAADRTKTPGERGAYLALLARWHVFELKRRDVATEFFAHLQKADPAHPFMLERRANEARAAGDLLGQKKNLLLALERATRKDDRKRLLLALAELHEGPLDQKKTAEGYYRTALDENPDLADAMKGLERLARARGDGAQVVVMLEREVELATDDRKRLDLRVKLAEEYEKLGDPARAVATVEPCLGVESHRNKAWVLVERAKGRLGDHEGVAQAMLARAAFTQSVKAKTELMVNAATLLENQVGDPDAALDAWRMVTIADEKNRRAFVELRRIATGLGRVADAVAWGIRVAELTKDKREAAALHVELGEVLLHDEGDALGAKLQFEKAADLDKKSVRALEALEQLARSAGDRGRADALFLRRAQATESPERAAELLVAVADERRDRGDVAGFVEALTEAHRRDPHNLAAVDALLDHYVDRGQFREAYPLCEQAIVAADRARDAQTGLRRRRLLTRASASLGELERALDAALAAFHFAPTDNGARDDLLEVATRVDPQSLERARGELGRIAEMARTLSPAALLRLAKSLQLAGDPERARAVLDRLLHQAPDDVEALEMLERIFFEARDWKEAARTKMHLARVMGSAEDRFVKLTQAGDIWARRENDLRAAISAFEEARRIKQNDPWLRETLTWAYEEAGDWQKLARMLRDDADANQGEARLQSLNELSNVIESKLRDTPALTQVLEEILDMDGARLDAFERLVRALTEAREWGDLERAYRKMLARAKGRTEPKLMLALWKQLGLIYRDRLRDNESALQAFAAARNLDPKDAEVRRMQLELAVLLGRHAETIALTRDAVRSDPLVPSYYVTLHELFLREQAFDKAWNALDVLAQLAELSGEHATYYADYPPYPPATVPGTLTEDAWRSHLLHPELDATLTTLFRHLCPAALRADGRMDGEPIALTAHHSQIADYVHACVADGAEILGLAPPALYAGQLPRAFTPRMLPAGSVTVSPGPLSATGDALLFEVGLMLATQRPELAALAFFPTLKELSTLLARAAQKDAQLFAAMTPEAQGEVRRILDEAARVGSKLDVRRWLFLAHASCARAALLLCGTANGGAIWYSQQIDDGQATEKLGELYAFAVSDEYAELRLAIGVAVGA